MKTQNLVFLFLFAFLFLSCSNDSEDDLIDNSNDTSQNDDPGQGQGGGNDPTNFQFNYEDDIKPIMQTSCVSCHASPPVNGAPFALVTYDQVRQRSSRVLATMDRQSGSPGAMPPSGRLPQATIDIVAQWISDGMPEN